MPYAQRGRGAFARPAAGAGVGQRVSRIESYDRCAYSLAAREAGAGPGKSRDDSYGARDRLSLPVTADGAGPAHRYRWVGREPKMEDRGSRSLQEVAIFDLLSSIFYPHLLSSRSA